MPKISPIYKYMKVIYAINLSFKVIEFFWHSSLLLLLLLIEEIFWQISIGSEKSIEIKIISIILRIKHVIERIKDEDENIEPAFLYVDFIKFFALQILMIITKIKQIKLNNNINIKIIKLAIDIFFQTIIIKQHSTKTMATE